MNGVMKIDTVQQYNDYFGIETSHPLVSVIEGKRAKPLRFRKKLNNLYSNYQKETESQNFKYPPRFPKHESPTKHL